MSNLIIIIYNYYGFILSIITNLSIPVLYTYLVLSSHLLIQQQFVKNADLSILFQTMLTFIIYYIIMQSMHVLSHFFLSRSLPYYIMKCKNKLMKYVCSLNFAQISHGNPIIIQDMIDKYITALSKILEQIWMIWMPLVTDLSVTILITVLHSNFKIFLILITWLICMGGIICFATILYSYLTSRNNQTYTKENEFIAENVNNLLLTKVLNTEGYLLSKFYELSYKSESTFSKGLVIIGFNKFFIGLFNVLLCLVSIYISRIFLRDFDKTTKLKFFSTFWSMTRILWNMATNIVTILDYYSEYKKSQKIFEHLKPDTHIYKNELQEITSISAHNYNLYINDRLLINDINFQWKNTGLILVKGRSGKGKTSFLLTLCGIHRNYSCQNLLINGISINNYSTPNILQHFAIALQQEYIFNLSIQENIILNNAFDNNILNMVLDHTGLIEIIKNRAWNIQTLLCGVNGAGLSGGERKLVSLARLLYRIYINVNVKYIIVLDEPFNHLDMYLVNEYIIPLITKLSKRYLIICTCHNNNLEVQSENILQL